MSEAEKAYIAKPEGHYCFACGTANPIGLNLRFYRNGDAVCADVTLKRVHEGWEGLAHGGIISTLLDEAMSWAIMYLKKTFLVTRKMSTKYVRNVTIGTPLIVSGKLTDDSNPPKVTAKAEIRDGEGRLLVRSTGEFVVLSNEDLTSVPEGMKQEMADLFRRFE
jgi:uncharacterized protein (TIGR00369 family)